MKEKENTYYIYSYELGKFPSYLLNKKDLYNHLKILTLSDKFITYGRGYSLSSTDISALCSIFNGYLDLVRRVEEYERKTTDSK